MKAPLAVLVAAVALIAHQGTVLGGPLPSGREKKNLRAPSTPHPGRSYRPQVRFPSRSSEDFSTSDRTDPRDPASNPYYPYYHQSEDGAQHFQYVQDRPHARTEGRREYRWNYDPSTDINTIAQLTQEEQTTSIRGRLLPYTPSQHLYDTHLTTTPPHIGDPGPSSAVFRDSSEELPYRDRDRTPPRRRFDAMQDD
ncbi:hypothetical protein CBS101457_002624 [Exobasidium rhododendri]|nr:hypothetical protein CBS101457_002624 [Exobasidium rhododendri]